MQKYRVGLHTSSSYLRTQVQVLNAVGIDYACLGNHEADVGLKALRKRLG